MSGRHQAKRAAMTANLKAKTGRKLEDWIEIVEGAPQSDVMAWGFMDRVRWLQSEHGLGHFQARLVVEEARERKQR